MKKLLTSLVIGCALILPAQNAYAEINLGRLLNAGLKTVQALSITDSQMASYVSASVAQMDKENTVATASDPYTRRLMRITDGLIYANGIPLNFKVYKTNEINAFACPDGSVRVYSGLMDLMTDEEVLGVVGHEIGHVSKHHSKKALKQQLMNGALADVLASTNGTVAALTDSQLGAIGQTLLSAKFSRKQEKEADDAGYELLKSTGHNPWAMAMAFEKMQSLESKNGAVANYLMKMFSSHPETKERIDRMAKRAQKDGFKRP